MLWPNVSGIHLLVEGNPGKPQPENLTQQVNYPGPLAREATMLLLGHSMGGSFSKLSVASLTSQLILQPFRRFTYIAAHSPTLPLLHLRHSSFSNTSIALPTSQLILQSLSLHLHHNSFFNASIELILQPFHCFTYVTAHSPTFLLLHLCHSSFSNPFFASPKSQALHLIYLVSRPCNREIHVARDQPSS